MAKVKIILEDGESLQSAEADLMKALDHHNSGDVHNEGFDDPAMQDTVDRMEKIHRDIYADMMREIFEALDEDYAGGN